MPDFARDLFADVDLTPDLLDTLFGNEENYGVIEEDTGDGALFPDGRRWSTCTSWAAYVCRALGERAVCLGFLDEDNPSSKIADLFGGHDFALVDGRYIVDGWLREVAGIGMDDRIVFDLENPGDADIIAKLYGDRAAWEVSGEDTNLENDSMRAQSMGSCRFAEILEASQSPAPAFS